MTVANHIYLPTVVTAQSTKAFRKPLVIAPYENLVEGRGCESLADFVTFDANVIDANGKSVRPVAEVVLHCRPDSEAAHNLITIEVVPFIPGIGLMAGNHNEFVGFEIDWFSSSITLAQGALIRYRRLADECEFTFSFSTVVRD